MNDGVLFNYLVELKGKNSFRGNLSVIQVDVKNVQVIREEYIAFYDTTKPEELLKLTGIGGIKDE